MVSHDIQPVADGVTALAQQWFCAAIQPSLTHLALASIARLNFETYVPVVSGHILFHGYVFILFDRIEHDGRWQRINRTLGVQRLLPKHLERPDPLPESYIPELKLLVSHENSLPPPTAKPLEPVFPGDFVLVRTGPISGQRVKVLKVTGQILRVGARLFHTEIPTRVRRDQCEIVGREVRLAA